MGMKVFTDTQSELKSEVYQPTASNLKVEPVQTDADNLHASVQNTGSASLLNAYVKQTTAANLHASVRNTSLASLLNTYVKQTTAANLHATMRNTSSASLLNAYVKQTTAANLYMTIGNRETLDTSATINVVTTSIAYGASQSVLNLSQFSFFVKGGTATTNVKIQLSPNDSDWLDDDTLTRTLAANTLTILTPTRFSKYVRLAGQGSGGSAILSVYSQGCV